MKMYTFTKIPDQGYSVTDNAAGYLFNVNRVNRVSKGSWWVATCRNGMRATAPTRWEACRELSRKLDNA